MKNKSKLSRLFRIPYKQARRNMDGWIKFHRKIKKHWLWNEGRPKTKLEAWMDLCLRASHAGLKEPIGRDLILVQRGQILTSQEGLSTDWKWDRGQTRSFLKMLVKDEMVHITTTKNFTMITICNYDSYNDAEPTDEQRRTNRLRGNRKKESGVNKKATINSTMLKDELSDTYKGAEPTDDQQMTNKRPTDDQQMNTYKNDKEREECKEVFIEEKKQFDAFVKWLKENAPNVLRMQEPLTQDQYTRLVKRFGKIGYMCKKMHNHKPLLQKNISAYLTIINWIELDEKRSAKA